MAIQGGPDFLYAAGIFAQHFFHLTHHCRNTWDTHEELFKTMKMLKTVFYWPKMKKRVKAFVRQREVCQQHKTETTMPLGLLQPLPTHTNVWAEVSMDFIIDLPKSHGFRLGNPLFWWLLTG
jgi:hypothetical protein